MSLALCLLDLGVRNQVCFLQLVFSDPALNLGMKWEHTGSAFSPLGSWLTAQTLVSHRARMYAAESSSWQMNRVMNVANSDSFPSTGLTEGTKRLGMRNERLWLEKKGLGMEKGKWRVGIEKERLRMGKWRMEMEKWRLRMKTGRLSMEKSRLAMERGRQGKEDGEGRDEDGEGETEDGGMEDRNGEEEDGTENGWWVWIRRGWGWRLGHL